jgi:hypothetical protein
MPFTTEITYKVWDDAHGSHIEVRPDGDSLDLVEVVFVDDDGQEGPRITMPPEQAALVARAIGETVKAIGKASGYARDGS